MNDAPNVSFFKKGKLRPSTTRQRSPPPPSNSPQPMTKVVNQSADSEVIIPSRKATSRLLSQGTKRPRKDDDDDDEDAGRVDVNWASGSSSNVNAALDILEGDEAEAILARKRAKLDAGNDDGLEPDDGLYHGQSGYKSHITKNKEIPKAMRVGPQKSTTSTIRTVTIVDYQPDVCKDYKGVLFFLPLSFKADFPAFRNWVLWFRRYLQVLARSWHLCV